MPEGPEMYLTAGKVARAVGDRPLEEVWFAFEHLQPWSQRLAGQSLRSVETLGKALLMRFDDGTTIYTHNQLYGRWLFAEAGRRPDTNRQLRLALSTDERSALLYSASEIQVIEPGQLEGHPFIARAGLDILSSGAGVDRVADWIHSDRFSRKRLGHLLLDQGFLAGVGNYLRSEILHVAGLDWQLRPRDLGDAAAQRLAEAAHSLMWRSVETGGLTNDPERVAQLRKAGWRRRDYRHFVFNRDGQVCFQCDAPIERVTVSGRRLYRCPVCQNAEEN
jgi:endonuclease-8